MRGTPTQKALFPALPGCFGKPKMAIKKVPDRSHWVCVVDFVWWIET
jgi:hypothetical protein